MSVFISEHGNLLGLTKSGVISAPRAAYPLTSAAASTIAAGVEYIRVSADAGSLLSIIPSVIGSSTATITSTNALRIAANGPPELFAVAAGNRILVAST